MTPTDIVNQALGLLGESAISGYDENLPVARAARAHYETTRDSLLRRHRWNFARKRAELSQLSEAPAFGFAHKYALPSDCLRVLQLNGLSALECEADFEIEGLELLTDADTAKIVYVARIADPSKWDSLFVEAFIYKLGAALAIQVADSLQKQQILESRFEQLKLPSAIGVDARESKPRVIHPGTGSESLASRGVSVDAFGASFGSGYSYPGATTGANGEPGDNGWTPNPATVTDGDRILLFVSWSGGEGAQPENGYVSPSGLTDISGNATDFRGVMGTIGNKGWSPILAVVEDGARRVLQVTDWTGGEGTKPDTGDYVGAAGLVALIGDGVDVRGPVGTGDVTGPGVSVVDENLAAWNGTSGSAIEDSGISKASVIASLVKTAWLTVTGAINLDTLAAAVTANSAKVTNATHTGDVTGATALTIANSAVTLAKMANLAASRIIGRKTSTGAPESLTLTEILDFIGSATAGDILYRGASNWSRLAADSDGKVLTLASGIPAWAGGGKLVKIQTSIITSTSTITSVIPADNTIPQSSEGDEVATITYTPLSASNNLDLEFEVMVSVSAVARVTAALFVNSDTNAVKAIGAVGAGAGFSNVVRLRYIVPAGSTTSRTYKIRMGPNSDSAYFNKGNSTDTYGGTSSAILSVKEYTP
jgi:hypothetical protein